MSDIWKVHLAAGDCGLEEACNVIVDQDRSTDNRRLIDGIGKIP